MAAAEPVSSRADPRSDTWVWVCGALVAALCLAAAALGWFGAGTDGITLAVRLTARLAFVAFWPAYVGGALVTLFGSVFEPVRRKGRELGLAFAAVLVVHLALVAWLSLSGHAPSIHTFVIFGIGVLWAAGLSLFSIQSLGRILGPLGWWTLRYVGMNYLLFDFALDFLRQPSSRRLASLLFYAPCQVLVLAAVALWLSAQAKKGLRALRAGQLQS